MDFNSRVTLVGVWTVTLKGKKKTLLSRLDEVAERIRWKLKLGYLQ